jgi:anti-sigma factor RsiW
MQLLRRLPGYHAAVFECRRESLDALADLHPAKTAAALLSAAFIPGLECGRRLSRLGSRGGAKEHIGGRGLMQRSRETITEQILGAYVDGELGREEGVAVEAALRGDGQLAQRVEALRRVTMLVKAAVRAADSAEPFAARRIDAEEEVGKSIAARRRSWRSIFDAVQPLRPLLASFSIGLMVALGAMLLWPTPHQADGQWARLTLALHERFVDAMRTGNVFPLDVSDPDPERVGKFLAATIGYAPSIPDLSADSYVLSGARIVTTSEGPVVYALYTSGENPLLGFVAVRRGRPASPTLGERAAVRLVTWQTGDAQFAFVGTHSAEQLERLAARYRGSIGLRAE